MSSRRPLVLKKQHFAFPRRKCFVLHLFLLLISHYISPGTAFVTPLHHRQTLFPQHSPRAQATRLQSSRIFVTPATTTAAAAIALTSSALSGMYMERRNPNSGILTSLAVSSLVFSRMAPSRHFLYDMCWNTFLPASLALLLLGMSQKTTTCATTAKEEEEEVENDPSVLHDDDSSSIRAVVLRLALPFGLASIGSLIGCTISFLLCRFFRSVPWFLSTADAAWAGACLSASFIGGSVNCLATAAWIAAHTTGQGTTTTATSLVSAMTAADLMVMALYFALVSAASQSIALQRWFNDDPRRNGGVRGEEGNGTTANASSTASSTDKDGRTTDDTRSVTPLTPSSSSRVYFPTAAFVTTIALTLVRVGQLLEHNICVIPGMACAFLATVTPLVRRYIRMPSQAGVVAPLLSQFCFYLLFAAVGRTADLGAALQSGPACLVFATVALLIHGLVVLIGGKYVLLSFGRGTSSLLFTDCLITSNAAIGGPATAATFCGTLKKNTQALTMAATIWGVFGYAIGTTVGVGMYRFLSFFV